VPAALARYSRHVSEDAGEVAYADLKRPASSLVFAAQAAMLPAKIPRVRYNSYRAGVDPNTQVTETGVGMVPGTVTKDATGGSVPPPSRLSHCARAISTRFREAYFTAKELPHREDTHLLAVAFGGGSGPTDLFFFSSDSNTAAFGQRQELES